MFGGDVSGVTKDGPIPVHLLSVFVTGVRSYEINLKTLFLESLSGDSWTAHYDNTKPFSDAAEEPRVSDDLLQHLHSTNYTSRTMFSKVYRFMKWLGFEKLPRTVWTQSIFSRNWSKDNMICQPATAYDMVAGEDYRIKACLQLGEGDWIAAHKLMSQLYYKFSARKQPTLLREPMNPSLPAAVSGAFETIASNVDYLKANKLLSPSAEPNEPAVINRLYKEALEDLVRLPFDIVADKWRYAVFDHGLSRGKGGGNWSSEWWSMREKYQGVSAPSEAGEGVMEFDAVASPAIAQQHAPASRHFVSYVAQFQVLKRLCEGSGAKTLVRGGDC